MYKASDLRKGLKIELDGEPHVIVGFEFSKPGKGQAIYKCRLRNMITGTQFDRSYRSGDAFKPASLEERDMEYLYNDGTFYTFMDAKTYDQIQLNNNEVGDAKNFLLDNLEVQILMWGEKPIGLTLPNFINVRIEKTEPAARGDTATNVTKPVTVSTGYTLQGPAFLEEGEMIQVDTRTGEYVTRVKG